MKRMLVAVLALFMVLCCGCTPEPAPTQPPAETLPTQSQTEPTVPETVPEETVPGDIAVETPCGTLYLPDEWDLPISYTTAQGDPAVITFLAEDVALYDLLFSETTVQSLGQVQTAKGIVYVGMTIHPLEEETDMLLSMQESVNVLLAQLNPQSVTVVPTEPTPAGDITLDTNYGTLHFPAKWKDCLKMQQPADDMVEFYCCLPDREPVLVFTVLLGKGADGPSAVITAPDGTETALYILVAEPEFDADWTDAEMDTVYAMQEDMNYLLEALQNGE